MRTSWVAETGELACRWAPASEGAGKKPDWLEGIAAVQGGYLPPGPDYASHSPFGGAFWFYPNPAEQAIK